MNNYHLIESVWYSQSKLNWLLWPFSLPFLLMVKLKRFLYQSEIISSHRFNTPVLVIGNISVGGTGKTPFINQLIRMLADEGIKAGVVSRGYLGSISRYPHQVRETDSVEQIGDEAFMQFLDLNVKDKLNIPMVIDPSRSNAVNHLLRSDDVDIVISDDGMQHYKMSRDIEVLLFDGKRQFGNRLILPFGPLREPVSRLETVQLVVQNGLSNIDKNCSDIDVRKNQITPHNVYLHARSVVNLKTRQEFPVDKFLQQKVVAVAGVGNPDRFFESLSAVCQLEVKKVFPDHHSFKMEDFESFGDEIIVMTEKDAAKCYEFAEDNWYYLKVDMLFNDILCDKILELVNSSIKKRKENRKVNE